MRLAPEEEMDTDNASAPFHGNATTPWVPDKWPPDPNLTDARYSAFIDKWPMTRGLGQFPFLFDWNYKRSGDAMHKNGTWKADPKTVFIKGRPDTIESLFEDLKVCCDTGPQEQLELFQHFFQGGVFWL